MRGKIDFGGSLTRLSFEAGRAHCAFSALDIDTPRNRILRATLQRLVTDARVSHPGAGERAERLRHELRDLVGAMEGVSNERVTSASFAQLQMGRGDRAYALPIAICALIHRLELPTEAEGDVAMAALMKDEITFHDLFERFVRNFWRHHLDDYEVGGETLDWFDELGCALVPKMRTDVVLTKRSSSRRLVVDTKYYAEALSTTHWGAARFNSANLYQMYAYLRTQEHLGEPFSSADGMLLYPTTSGHIDETMKVQGHRIRFATVDLAQPWESVEQRLRFLVRGDDG